MEFVKYRVKIERIDVQEIERREWLKVADTGNEHDKGALYDYVTHPDIQYVTTDLLTQEIRDENLDIKAVIKAINGI